LTENKQVVQGVRTGGRSARVRAAVLDATLAELAESGYAALTVDNVARRAGVNKTTVYRRWTDRESLVADALTEWASADIPIPDTGDLEGDLRALATSMASVLDTPIGRAVVATLVSVGNPGLVGVKRRFFGERHRAATPIVERAVARGELPPEVDPAAVIVTLRAPLYDRILLGDGVVDEALVERAVRIAVAAARSGALDR